MLSNISSLGSLLPLLGGRKEAGGALSGSVLRWESAGTQTGSWAILAQSLTLPQALASKGAQVDWNKSLWKSDMQIRSDSLGQVGANPTLLSPRKKLPNGGFREGLSYAAYGKADLHTSHPVTD